MLVVEEVAEIVPVKGGLAVFVHLVGDVAGLLGRAGAGGTDDQIALHGAAVGVVGGKVQRDGLVKVIAGHKAQLIQGVLAVVAVLVVELVVVDGAVGEGLLVTAVVVKVHEAGLGAGEGVVSLKGDEPDVVVLVLLLEEVVEIVPVKGDFLAGIHLVGDVAVVGAVSHQDLHRAVHIAAAGVIGPEVQGDGALAAAGDKAQAVEVVVAVTGAVIEPLILQAAGGEGLLVTAFIIVIDSAAGGGEGVVSLKGDVLDGVVAVLLLEHVVEVPAVEFHHIVGIHLVGNGVGAAGAALHLNDQGALGVLGAGVAGPEVQRNGAGLVAGHKAQVVQIVVAVAGAVIKALVFQRASAEGLLVAAAVIVINSAAGGGEGVVGLKFHPAQGAGREFVLINIPEIAAVEGNALVGLDGIRNGVVGAHVVKGVIGGVGAQGGAGHLGRALVALPVIDRGAAGVGSGPAHEGISLAALGLGGRAGVGGRGALGDGLGAVCAGSVHKGDGDPVGHRHAAPVAHITHAVAVGVGMGSLGRRAAADGADLPVGTGIVGILTGGKGVAGLAEMLRAAGGGGAGVPVLGGVPGPAGSCLVGVGGGDGHRLFVLAHGALLIPLTGLEAGGGLGGDGGAEVVGLVVSPGVTVLIGADVPVIGSVAGPGRSIMVLLSRGGGDQACCQSQSQQKCRQAFFPHTFHVSPSVIQDGGWILSACTISKKLFVIMNKL